MAEHALIVELYYDAAWHAVPVYDRDTCTIMRGGRSPGVEPASATLTLDNRSGWYSPRSVASPLYGKIGQNTRARITVDGSVRLLGEVASWEPGRAVRGDAWTRIQVAGVLQRIGRGQDPLQSPIYRAVAAIDPGAFWPLDDLAGAPEAVSAVGGAPMSVTPAVTFAAYEDLAGTLRAAEVSTGTLHGAVPGAAAPANADVAWVLGFAMKTPVQILNDPATFVPMLTVVTPGTTGAFVRWEVNTTIIQFGEITLEGFYADGTGIFFSYVLPNQANAWFDNQWHYYEYSVAYVGATDRYQVACYVDGVYCGGTSRLETGASVGGVTEIFVNQTGYNFGTFGISDVYVSNNSSTLANAGKAANGYLGETAADRFTRLCGEQAIVSDVVGTASESVAMGPQRPIALLALLDEIARTDDASIFETRDAVGLTLRTGASKLNQAPDLTVSYLGQIRPPLAPVIGDVGLRNDVTASSPTGQTARVQQLTGPRNVQLPEDDPQGVGRYQTRVDVNPATQSGLADAAGWRVVQGTFDGTWYAAVVVDLDAAPGLTAAVAALDIGDVLALSSLPADEALDTVSGLIVGIEDSVGTFRRTVTLYCVPAEPYRVGVLATTTGDTGDFLGHLDTDGATTVTAVAVGATSFQVATTSGPLWTTDADDFPLDVIAGGQRVSISTVTGAASPQTFTVQAGGLPVRYPIAAGSAVVVQQPVILSL